MSVVPQTFVDVNVRDLNVWRHQRWVLQNVNFSLPAGGFAVVCGPNGAGKSTLLRAFSGLLLSDDGWQVQGECGLVFANGVVEASLQGRRQRVSFFNQTLSPVEVLTVREFLQLSARISPSQSYTSILQMFALRELEASLLSQLSGGQWQRVRLAQLFMQDADVLVLDEPDAYLDAHWRSVLYAQLAERTRRGCLVLVSLHRPNEAASWATHVLGLEAGRLMFCEPFRLPAASFLIERLFLGKRLDSPEPVV